MKPSGDYNIQFPVNLVECCPTLEPQHSLEHAKELVDEFEAQLHFAGQRPRLKIKWQVIAEAMHPMANNRRSNEDGHGSKSEIGNGSKAVQRTAAAPTAYSTR